MYNICASVSAQTIKECISQIGNANMAELRLDLTGISRSEIEMLINKCKKWIITVRNDFFEKENYLSFFEKAASFNPDYIDIDYLIKDKKEMSAINSIIKESKSKLIYSFHDFNKTPEYSKMLSMIETMFSDGADVVKFVCTANSFDDNIRVLSLYDKFKKLIAFNMGYYGKITRISSLFYGERISYAVLDSDMKTAPGQFTIDEMLSMIKFFNK